MTEREAIELSYRFLKRIEEALTCSDEPQKVFERLSKDAKRYSSLILSAGLLDATLFIFSKARETNIKKELNQLVKIENEEAKLGEAERWAIISKFVCEIANRHLGTSEPLEIVEKLVKPEMEDLLLELESDVLIATKALARLLEAKSF